MPFGDASLAQLSAPFLAPVCAWTGRTKDASNGLSSREVGHLAGLNYFSVWSLYDVCCSRDGDAFMPKNIVVYSDGTGQDGGVRPEQRISNVYKMYRPSRVHPDNAIDPAEQVCFYGPGLGTDSGASGLTGIMRKIDKLLQSVTGRGITKNMTDCYEFIINHYEGGDRIYLIGFSRGAYTVRCLANTIMLCGIPTKAENGSLLRYRKQVHDIAREALKPFMSMAPDMRVAIMRLSVTSRLEDFALSTVRILSAKMPTRTGPTRRRTLLVCLIRSRRSARVACAGF